MIHKYVRAALLVAATLLHLGVSWAQLPTPCPLVVRQTVQVPLSSATQPTVTLTVNNLLASAPACASRFLLFVRDDAGNIRSANLDCTDVGSTLSATVFDPITGASAVVAVTVVDLIAPVVIATDVSVACTADLSTVIGYTASDNCTATADLQLIVTEASGSITCGTNALELNRTITAVDAAGNRSVPVQQTVTLTREPLANVQLPANQQVLSSVVGCPAQQSVANYPVAVPTVNGQPINDICKLLFTTEDLIAPTCGDGFKLVRKYTILDCCTGEVRTDFVTIDFVDDVAPVVTPFASPILATAIGTPNDCSYSITFPAVTAVDACSAVDVRIVTPVGTVESNGGLLAGPFSEAEATLTATYEVRDACGNLATTTLEVTAVDNVPPVALCKSDVVVGLTTSLNTIVPAETFDLEFDNTGVLGSFDNCGIVAVLAQRDDVPSSFGPTVAFTCADVGQLIPVTFRVVDAAGLTNDCPNTVRVENNIRPSITAPANASVDCTDLPTVLAGTSLTGNATVNANCVTYTITFDDVIASSPGCPFGAITRTFTATPNNGGSTLTATQLITVSDSGIPDFSVTLPDLQVDCDETLDVNTLNPPTIGTTCQSFAVSVQVIPFSTPVPDPDKLIAVYTYTSLCGTGMGELRQVLELVDNDAPTVVPPATPFNEMVQCESDVVNQVPTFTDNCTDATDINVSSSASTTDRSLLANCVDFIRTITYTATDEAGNSTDVIVTIEVKDTEPPVIGALPSYPMAPFGCLAEVPSNSNIDRANLALLDNCSPSADIALDISDTVVPADPANPTCSGIVERVFTVTDNCGNSNVYTASIAYQSAPTLLAGSVIPLQFDCYDDLPAPDETLIFEVGANATCPTQLTLLGVSTEPEPLTVPCRYTIDRTYTFENSCGVQSSFSRTFTIEDNEAPTFDIFPAVALNLSASVTLDPSDCRTQDIGGIGQRNLQDCSTTAAADFTYSLSASAGVQVTANADLSNSNISFPVGLSTLTFEITDKCNNTAVRRAEISAVPPDFQFACGSAPTRDVLTDGTPVVVDTNDLKTQFSFSGSCDLPPPQAVFIDPPLSLADRTIDVSDFPLAFPGLTQQLNFTLVVIDPFGIRRECPSFVLLTLVDPPVVPVSQSNLAGTVVSPLTGQTVAGAAVRARGASGTWTATTDHAGAYEFTGLPNETIRVLAESAAPAAAGVTGYDIGLVGRHLTHTRRLSSPQELLAADVDQSGRISSADITRMRRVILGLDDYFPGEHSGLSYALAHEFSTPNEPWLDAKNWDPLVALNDLGGPVNLALIKLGDLNPRLQPRSAGAAELILTDHVVRTGEQLQIPVFLRADEAISGYQLALQGAGEVRLTPSESESDLQSHRVADEVRALAMDQRLPGEQLFLLEFTARQDGRLSDLLTWGRSLVAEAYSTATGNPIALALSWQTDETPAAASVLAFPNPFANTLVAQLNLPIPGTHVLTVTDLTGKRFAERPMDIPTGGVYRETLSAVRWPAGVYHLRIHGPSGNLVQRIVLQR